MSKHIEATQDQIAQTVLMPGDPVRAKWIANKFLKDSFQYNTVRNMFGYTGKAPNGSQISVQGSGMGMPSLSIYVNELIREYNVKKIIRVGSAGSLSPKYPLGTVIIAMGACSDSAMNNRRFHGMSYAPMADWNLLKSADVAADVLDIPIQVGNIVSVDKFYEDGIPETKDVFAEYGVMAIEMETAELYTLAAKHNVQALSILTISDELWGEKRFISPKERESSFDSMVKIAASL